MGCCVVDVTTNSIPQTRPVVKWFLLAFISLWQGWCAHPQGTPLPPDSASHRVQQLPGLQQKTWDEAPFLTDIIHDVL